MSDFGALRTALTALYAQRRGLEVTGHNISNANTEGFSRQRVDTAADTGPMVPAFFSRWEGSGMGVSIKDVTRTRDLFLETRSHLEHGAESSLQRTQGVLGRLELLFNEPGDQGIQKQLADFWAGWDDVANRPEDLAARRQLVERATTLTTTVNKVATDMSALRTSMIDELDAVVSEINSLATNIADLNEAIQTARVSGLEHNDLLDQRDLLVSQLSDRIGVRVRQADNGMVDVFVEGGTIVRGDVVETLYVDTSGATVDVRWTKDGYAANSATGDVGGLLSSINDIVPRYLYGANTTWGAADTAPGLDDIAYQLMTAVNGLHASVGGSIVAAQQDQSAAGVLSFQLSLNGAPNVTVNLAGADWTDDAATLGASLQAAVDAAVGGPPGQVVATVSQPGGAGTALEVSLAGATAGDTLTVQAAGANQGLAVLLGTTALGRDGVGGRAFFSVNAATPGAATLAVDAGIAADPLQVAAARAGSGALDGGAALALAALADQVSGPDQSYRAFIVRLGVETQTANRRAAIQRDATRQVDQAREAQAGVNLDEEMSGMILFQHAYSAAARYMTSIDEMLETLIGRTGHVGR